MKGFLQMFCCVAERQEPLFAPQPLAAPPSPEPVSEPQPTEQNITENVLHPPLPSVSSMGSNRERNNSTDTLDTAASMTPSKLAVDSLFLRPSSQKKLIRRVSSMTTKEHREFRFFLPQVSESDTWIDKSAYESYVSALQTLLSSIRESDPTAGVVSRHDSYLIGKAYFGIKYNDEAKLEMKVRTENRPIWMEKWSKVRFGKKELSHYKSDIVTYLSDVGHKDPVHEEMVDHPRYVNVACSKQQYNLRSVALEVSELVIADDSSPSPSQSSSPSSSSVSLASRRQWLTIVVGGDSTAIESFVKEQQEKRTLWAALRLCHDIFLQQTDDALSHCFLPVVSGYPLWLRLVSNSLGSESNAVNEEVMPAVESFLSFLSLVDEDDLGAVADVKPFDLNDVAPRR